MDSEKSFFTIAEVEEITGLPKHTLRSWESRFAHIRPERRNSRRYYRQHHIDAILQVKELMRNQGMGTRAASRHIAGKRKQLAPAALAFRVNEAIRGVDKLLDKLGRY